MAATEGDGRRARRHRRGVSAVVSTVMVIGLVLAGAAGVAMLGADLVDEGREDVGRSLSETTLLQLRDDASDTAHGADDARTVELPSHGTDLRVDPDAGRINVSVTDASGDVESVLVDEPLGAARYDHGDATVAYQGTGVWKRTGSGTTMVAPPQVQVREGTLFLPVQTVDGEGSVAGAATVRADSTAALAPAEGPLDAGDRLRITVRSEYYEAWGAYWETETGAAVEYDHDARSVTATFVPSGDAPAVDAAAVGTAPGTETRMTGSGAFPAFADSYDSSEGPYAAGSGADGTVVSAGAVHVGGNAEIEGDVRSGDAVELRGTAAVDGDVYWTDDFDVAGSPTYGDDGRIGGVDRRSAVSPHAVVDAIAGDNDNGETPAIAGDSLASAGGTRVLPAGDYYLEELSLSSERLVLDARDGPIRIAVRDLVALDDATVEVRGDHPVRVYVRGDAETSRGNGVEVRRGSAIDVPEDRATQFWLYAAEGTDVSIRGSAGDRSRVVGVVYAPSDADGEATVRHASVYGSVVSGAVHVETGGHLAYDEALADRRPLADDGGPWVEHVHVARSDVRLEGG